MTKVKSGKGIRGHAVFDLRRDFVASVRGGWEDESSHTKYEKRLLRYNIESEGTLIAFTTLLHSKKRVERNFLQVVIWTFGGVEWRLWETWSSHIVSHCVHYLSFFPPSHLLILWLQYITVSLNLVSCDSFIASSYIKESGWGGGGWRVGENENRTESCRKNWWSADEIKEEREDKRGDRTERKLNIAMVLLIPMWFSPSFYSGDEINLTCLIWCLCFPLSHSVLSPDKYLMLFPVIMLNSVNITWRIFFFYPYFTLSDVFLLFWLSWWCFVTHVRITCNMKHGRWRKR